MKTVNNRRPTARLIDRLCQCGQPLTEPAPNCRWHATHSAEYASDLLAILKVGIGPRERTFRRLLRRARRGMP